MVWSAYGRFSVCALIPAYRATKKRYANEEEFNAAWSQWKKEHPLPRGSIHDVVDHIEHIIKVAGIDCVGLGSDFDGITKVPAQLEDVSTYPLITQELLNRGHKPADIRKIMSGNILRVMRAAEKVAAELAAK